MDRPSRSEILLAALIMALTFAIRLWRADQPIVENYVGRQIPTAMVARDLASEGGRFLAPQLQTGPFPNYFLIEPPLFAWLAAQTARVGLWEMEASGRVLSAIGSALTVWGLLGLVRRRDGPRVAFAAAIIFAALPVALRYGRAFQGDALMLGCLTASIRCFDEARSRSERRTAMLAAGWLLGSAAIALKAISLLVWLALTRATAPRSVPIGVLMTAAIPALAWYANAAGLLIDPNGSASRAASDSVAIWLQALSPSALFDTRAWARLARCAAWSCFTPMIWPLWIAAAWTRRIRSEPAVRDRLAAIWLASAVLTLLILARKAHHEYYWLLAAPPAALFAARGWTRIARRSRTIAAIMAATFLAIAARQTAPTWRTPAEWTAITEAAAQVECRVPANAWLIAPEALIHQSRRKGCRLEFEPESIRRAAGEWGASLDPIADGLSPQVLVEAYRDRGAEYFADLDPAPSDPIRQALHEYVRRRHVVLADEPGVVLIARLKPQRPSSPVLTERPQVPNPERGTDP